MSKVQLAHILIKKKKKGWFAPSIHSRLDNITFLKID